MRSERQKCQCAVIEVAREQSPPPHNHTLPLLTGLQEVGTAAADAIKYCEAN
jgi:hypothetical protein